MHKIKEKHIIPALTPTHGLSYQLLFMLLSIRLSSQFYYRLLSLRPNTKRMASHVDFYSSSISLCIAVSPPLARFSSSHFDISLCNMHILLAVIIESQVAKLQSRQPIEGLVLFYYCYYYFNKICITFFYRHNLLPIFKSRYIT